MDNEIIVIGAGFSGSIMARLFAEKGKRVKVIERRKHIGGNMYDCIEDGIRIQKYGPHIFHTNIDKVYRFLCKYCELTPYRLKCSAFIKGVETPSPFNFKTIDQFYDPSKANLLKKKLVDYYQSMSATVLEMLSCEDNDIRTYAQFLFREDYRPYTAKQWGLNPEEIDASVLQRVPVVFSYNETYFSDKYEGLPKEGFTKLFKNLLNHPNIDINLGVDAINHIDIETRNKKILFDKKEVPIIFTGALDELFGYIYGPLPYRTLHFEYENYSIKNYQSTAIVAYPSNTQYTRITEYTKLPYQEVGDRTIIAREYPMQYETNNKDKKEPYYPVLTEESIKTFTAYRTYAEQFNNLTLCGRLADFKYYNMDAVIAQTLSVFEDIQKNVSWWNS